MKRKSNIQIVLILFLASLIFLFGNSVNVWHYCCDLCQNQGPEVIENGICHEKSSAPCCKTDPNQQSSHSSNCSKDHTSVQYIGQANDHACFLENISIFLDIQDFKTEHKILSHDLLMVVACVLFQFEPFQTPTYQLTNSLHPPLSGRQILALNCILRR